MVKKQSQFNQLLGTLKIIKVIVFLSLVLTMTNDQLQAEAPNSSGERSRTIDSLKQELVKAADDTSKIKILYEVFFYYRRVEYKPDTALLYGNQYLAIAEQLNPKFLQGPRREWFILHIGIIYDYVGVTYYAKGDYSLAMKNYLKAEKTYGKINHLGQIAQCYNRMGHIFQKQGRDSLTLVYFFKALDTYESAQDKRGMAIMLNNIGEVYTEQGKYAEAIDYHLRSLEFKKEIGYHRGTAMSYNNIGEIHFRKNEIQKALDFHHKALDIQREINDQQGLTTSLNSIGDLYLYQNKGREALRYLLECAEIAKDLHAKIEIKNAYESISKAYAQLHNHQKAYYYHQLFSTTKDSVFNEASAKQIAEMQTKYETEKKEKEIVTLNSEKRIQTLELQQEKAKNKTQFIIFSVGLLFLIVVSTLLYNRHRLKQKAIVERKFNQLQKEHFKAVLVQIEKEKKSIALELHDGLGHLLSTAKLNVSCLEDALVDSDTEEKKIWRNSMDIIDEACQEVRNVSHSMMPSALIRQGIEPAVRELLRKINTAKKIDVHFYSEGIGREIDESVEIALYRIIQEVLNNIIKHSNAKNASINMIKQGNNISLVIKDDGIGIDLEKMNQSDGIGWKNISSRVAMMNGEMNIKGIPGEGSVIDIKLAV